MKKIIIILAMVLMVSFAFGQTIGSAPTVSGVAMVQQGGIVTVTYNLSYEDETPPYSHITLVISNDGGTTFKISPMPAFLSGDIAAGITVGEGKKITWRINDQYSAYGDQGLVGENFRARVIAKRDDNYNPADPANSVPAGMVFVQGTGANGDPEAVTFNPGGLGFFSPGGTYDVSLSSFYISQFAVTQAEWTAVMGGIYNPIWTDRGQGPNHPAYRTSWFDAIEYCNRRSIMEGLTPAYSYTVGETEHGTDPDDWPAGWNTSNANHTNVSCNWNVNGYRLPTEMEREYAARGGVPAANAGTFNHLYAGTNVAGIGIGELGDYAWYSANNTPNGSKAVGTKLPNELNLYDMSGNVMNWVWDIGAYYPTGPHNDPKGSPTGTGRVSRGGSSGSNASGCRVTYPYYSLATVINSARGFRVSRTLN